VTAPSLKQEVAMKWSAGFMRKSAAAVRPSSSSIPVPGKGINRGRRQKQELEAGHLDQKVVMEKDDHQVSISSKPAGNVDRMSTPNSGTKPPARTHSQSSAGICDAVSEIRSEEPDCSRRRSATAAAKSVQPGPARPAPAGQSTMNAPQAEQSKNQESRASEDQGGEEVGESGNHDRRGNQEQAEQQEEKEIDRRFPVFIRSRSACAPSSVAPFAASIPSTPRIIAGT